jgi:UDPglucose 6-dehydrogenase
MKNFKIGYVGLTHLGLTYLTSSVIKNHDVIGYDLDKKKIENFNNNNFEITEKSLIKKLQLHKDKIFYTDKIKNLNKCHLIFVSCDIKTNFNNKSDYTQLNKYLKLIRQTISFKIPVIILSQVKPGFTRSLKLEKFKLYYQVETLIFGKALKQAINPKRIIVGKKNNKEEIESKYFAYLKKFNCPVVEMKYESAELCKIAINIMLASSLTAANTIANISEEIDADFSEIIPALKLDPRIGKKSYIHPGLGISGGNLERDIFTIKKLIKEKNIKNNNLMNSINEISEKRKNWIFDMCKKIFVKNSIFKVGIYGYTYKKDNSSYKNSPTINLLKNLQRYQIKVGVYDDLLSPKKKNLKVNFYSDPKNMVKDCDLLIFMRDFKNKKKIEKINYSGLMKNNFIIDPFGNFKEIFNKKIKFNYITMGRKYD